MIDENALVMAHQAHKQVTLTYMKEKTGEIVTHTGGIYEIGTNKLGKPVVWLWDTFANDNIRQFIIANIQNLQVLDVDFQDVFGWGFKMNGTIIP